MKKYILLSICGFVGLGSLFYFYSRSDSNLVYKHENVLKLILTAKHAEATLEKDLLKSRNYLLLNYDPIVNNESEISKICSNLRSDDYAIYKVLNSQVDQAIDDYCLVVESKMRNVERFKSKNAVFRNSIYFLQKMATDSILLRNNALATLQYELIRASLAYALLSTDDAKKALDQTIEETRIFLKKNEVKDLRVLLSHATLISKVKDDLDILTRDAVGSNSSELLELIRERYFRGYKRAEGTANFYRQTLFGVSTVFLFLIVFGVVQLWKAARALTHANATLEMRVKKRTKDLQKSKDTIMQQQQILVTTAKMSALGEMAGGIAHEISTPLAVIRMRAEQIERGICDEEIDVIEFMDAIDIIKKTVDRIAKIVGGLRFFAHEGKSAPVQPIQINVLIQETLGFCRERFANHGVQLEVEFSGCEMVQIECRSVEISQVLLNLLNNAFDAVQLLETKWVKINVEEQNEYVELSVTDSGDGIPNEVRDKLMQPFFTTKEIGKGTGLGLSISRGIVESHQGKLHLDVTCANTRFVVRLPKHQQIPLPKAA